MPFKKRGKETGDISTGMAFFPLRYREGGECTHIQSRGVYLEAVNSKYHGGHLRTLGVSCG